MDKRKLNNNSRQRRLAIKDGSKSLVKSLKQLQRELFALLDMRLVRLLNIENGAIVAGAENTQLFLASTFLDNFFNKADRHTRQVFRSTFRRMNNLGIDRYKILGIAGLEDTKKIVFKKMAVLAGDKGFKGGVLNNQVNTKNLLPDLKRKVIAAIARGQDYQTFKDQMKVYIEGDKKKMGSMESYHFHDPKTNDLFVEYDRRLQNELSSALNLNYAIYQGTKKKTTRSFCLERVGNVYNREEILSWNNQDWDGKIEGANVTTALGGYNCSHYLDWISYELAQSLRPSIPKSKFDTNV